MPSLHERPSVSKTSSKKLGEFDTTRVDEMDRSPENEQLSASTKRGGRFGLDFPSVGRRSNPAGGTTLTRCVHVVDLSLFARQPRDGA